MSESTKSLLDSSTRRAFALDSRTVWVEQQIRQQVLIPKENLPIGPAEYSPKKLETHVSTPALGKFRGPADHFRSFHSHLSLETPNQRTRRSKSPERSENVTIFHNHNTRDPLDPKLRFNPTPDPYLSHDPVLLSKNIYGVHHVKDTLQFGKNHLPFGERIPTRKALPEYTVNYDSQQLRPIPLLTSFPKSKRIYIPKKGEKIFTDDSVGEFNTSLSRSQSPDGGGTGRRVGGAIGRSRSPASKYRSAGEQMSVFQMRCNLVVLPKLKTRSPPKLIFNDSSYKRDAKKLPVLLTPKIVREKAKVNLFHNLLTVPRSHKSASFA